MRVLAIGSVLLIAACGASRPPTIQQDRYHADLSRYASIRVIVDTAREIKASEPVEVVLAELRRSFEDQIRAAGKFALIDDPGAANLVEVRLTVTTMGVNTRRGGLGINLTLTDARSREALLNINARVVERAGNSTSTATVAAIARDLADRVSETAKR